MERQSKEVRNITYSIIVEPTIGRGGSLVSGVFYSGHHWRMMLWQPLLGNKVVAFV